MVRVTLVRVVKSGVDSFRLWYVVVDVEEERFSGRDVDRIATQANTQSTKRIWYKEYI